MTKEENRSKEKSIETVVSQTGLQMVTSFPCRICVAGLLVGVSLTTMFLTATSRSFAFGRISFSTFPNGITSSNPSTSDHITDVDQLEKVSFLYSSWTASLNESMNGEGDQLPQGADQVRRSNVPKAPHLENCKLTVQVNENLDKRVGNESFPPWTLWKGLLNTHPMSTASEGLKAKDGAYPPWIMGSDEENYPSTKKVQRDIWIHQHPLNCNDPNVKFLLADWDPAAHLGMGAQFNGMFGLFGMAITEKRVLVTNYYNRADHDGCKGRSRSSWSCYFFPETSQECRDRAFQLVKDKEAWENGIITGHYNYTPDQTWTGKAPRVWGGPWTYIQPTTDINGTLVASHHMMGTRWWRAQALRYLMRFQAEYTCNLLNVERHAAFGEEAAKMVVLATPAEEWLKEFTEEPQSDIERFVWSNHKAWIPRPLLSMHVRMGDKGSEMKMVGFEGYMYLAERIRKRFPHVHNIFVSTEMQVVIDKLGSYPRWNFYYTKVARQVGNTSMADYTANLGRKISTNYPLVNLLMAADSDFFIGALGSTWSYHIDGMRNTGGKVMAGYLSVNWDRFWCKSLVLTIESVQGCCEESKDALDCACQIASWCKSGSLKVPVSSSLGIMTMEENRSKEKSIETVVSQTGLQMVTSFPCRVCVAGLLVGVFLTTVFLTATSRSFAFGRISFSTFPNGITSSNPSSDHITDIDQEKVSFLYSSWTASLNESMNGEGDQLPQGADQVRRSKNVPKAPHLENCKLTVQVNENLDKRVGNESLPPWTLWKGLLNTYPRSTASEGLKSEGGAYPPWITGSDEENYPSTRKVQRDIWIYQHPLNCSDPNVKFLVADWVSAAYYGMGAQFNAMTGLFGMAINEKRVLVTTYYNRADHDGCKGPLRSSWSCYFFPETSQECRDRAFQLVKDKEAWEKGIVTGNYNYTSDQTWIGEAPRVWGDPWTYVQPTTDINGTLLASHGTIDTRWWRAQALRYLMRFQTEYTCNLLNVERHAAFGEEAAKMVVLETPHKEWLKGFTKQPQSDIERFVWSNHKAWIPRPLLSMHVRMGDKAREMKMVGFEGYMYLAERIKRRFPHVHNIYISTEMQEVIDKSGSYPRWNFYYTKVARQMGNTSMEDYTASLGRKISTNYPMVNFLMAADSDFFIGALGSTWSYHIDGMRNTGGKVMAGYLSVNWDRYWGSINR